MRYTECRGFAFSLNSRLLKVIVSVPRYRISKPNADIHIDTVLYKVEANNQIVMDRKIWVFLKKKEWFFWFFWFFSQITVYKRMDKWFFYLGFFGFFPKKPGFFGFFPIVIAFVDIL